MNIRAGKSLALAQNILFEKTCNCYGKACALNGEVKHDCVTHILLRV